MGRLLSLWKNSKSTMNLSTVYLCILLVMYIFTISAGNESTMGCPDPIGNWGCSRDFKLIRYQVKKIFNLFLLFYEHLKVTKVQNNPNVQIFTLA